MRTKKIQEILIPHKHGVSTIPSISVDEKLIRAVELMLDNNLEKITVIRNKEIIGMVRLRDALDMLGLKGPLGD